MGRSVSTPTNASWVTYQPVLFQDHDYGVQYDEEQDCYVFSDGSPVDEESYAVFFNFEDVIEWLQYAGKDRWPSFTECDKWIGDEDHAVLENDHAYLGVSEYCGMLSIWLVPKENEISDNVYYSGKDTFGLAMNWINQIGPKFADTFGKYAKVATFSNGEAVYERV